MAGVGLGPALDQAGEHGGAGRLGQRGELAEGVLRVLDGALGPDAGEHDALQAQLPVLDLGDVLELGGEAGDAAQRRALLALELVAVEAGEVGVVLVPGVVVGEGGGLELEELRSWGHSLPLGCTLCGPQGRTD